MIEIRSCKFLGTVCSKEGLCGVVSELCQAGGPTCSESLLRHLARTCYLAEARQPGWSDGRLLQEQWLKVIQRIVRDGASDEPGGGV